MEYINNLFSTLATHAVLKTILAVIGGFFIYLIGANNMGALAVVASLCLIDTIMAMYVLHREQKPVTSRKLPKKIYDLTVYVIIIMTMNLLTLINAKLGMFVDIAILYCAATEAFSILEHAGTLGFKIPISILKEVKKQTK